MLHISSGWVMILLILSYNTCDHTSTMESTFFVKWMWISKRNNKLDILLPNRKFSCPLGITSQARRYHGGVRHEIKGGWSSVAAHGRWWRWLPLPPCLLLVRTPAKKRKYRRQSQGGARPWCPPRTGHLVVEHRSCCEVWSSWLLFISWKESVLDLKWLWLAASGVGGLAVGSFRAQGCRLCSDLGNLERNNSGRKRGRKYLCCVYRRSTEIGPKYSFSVSIQAQRTRFALCSRHGDL